MQAVSFQVKLFQVLEEHRENRIRITAEKKRVEDKGRDASDYNRLFEEKSERI